MGVVSSGGGPGILEAGGSAETCWSRMANTAQEGFSLVFPGVYILRL